MSARTDTPAKPRTQWTVDELGQESGLPVRTIREYQTMGLMHPPLRAGRRGLYDTSHLRRLQVIRRLQDRGYSLAGIGDLLARWREGAALADILGIEPDQLVHVDEPGAPVTLEQLRGLVPALVPDRLDELVASGVIEMLGPDDLCIPSPSLLQLTIDSLAAGIPPDTVLRLLSSFRAAADSVADSVVDAFSTISGFDEAAIDTLVSRGRGLLAHSLGRLTLHRLGRAVEHASNDTTRQIVQRLTRGS